MLIQIELCLFKICLKFDSFYEWLPRVMWKGYRKWIYCVILNPGVPCSKPLGDSKVDSAVHPSDVDKMSTRNFGELSGKK